MDFTIDNTTAELTGLVREMGEQLVTEESLRELDTRFGPGTESGGADKDTARFHARFWDELVRAGVPAALAPERLGGAGLGVVGEALVMRELGRVLAPVPLSPAIRAAYLLAAAGQGDHAAAVAEGRAIAAVADGSAPEVDWAPVADLFLRVGGNRGGESHDDDNTTLSLTDRDAATVERTIPVDFSSAGSVTADQADSTPLPAGVAEFDALRRRVHLTAHQWGVVEAALERTAEYATHRHQFGRPIGSFQAVAARLADGMIDVDAVRLSTLRAAYELDACSAEAAARETTALETSAAARSAVAFAHFWACDAGHRLAHSAVHIHGGVGLDRSEPAHRYFLAAKANEFRLGGATRQLLDLGDVLATEGDPWEYSA